MTKQSLDVFELSYIRADLTMGWDYYIKYNQTHDSVYYVFRWREAEDISTLIVGVLDKRPSKKGWTKYGCVNITNILNSNPSENKDKYIDTIISTLCNKISG